MTEEDKQLAVDVSDLDSEVVHILRASISSALNFNSSYADDDVRLLCCLAQRAVLAGLAADAMPATRQRFERASEPKREMHESALGFAILKQGKTA